MLNMRPGSIGWRGALVAVVLCTGSQALAQETREGAYDWPGAHVRPIPADFETAFRGLPIDNGLPNIVLTGFWPPTNDMIRQFSNNIAQNPGGWVGEDWEGRGYNIYAFFPEFPGGTGSNPKGNGDFEVDYQDTSNDFWAIVPPLNPVAIIAFGRSGVDRDWELEGENRRYTTTQYSADYLSPTRPTPELPFYNEPVGTQRPSTLSLQAVVDAITASGLNLVPYYTAYDESKFVCSFMGYHVNWYHELHADPNDPAWNVSSGFIHIGSAMSLAEATAATEITVRTVIEYIDPQLYPLGDMDGDRDIDGDDFAAFAACLTGPDGTLGPGCDRATLDGDTDADLADALVFQQVFTGS